MTVGGCGDVTAVEADAGPARDAALFDAGSSELVVAITPERVELFEGDSAELEVAVRGGAATGEGAEFSCTSSDVSVAVVARTTAGCRVVGEAPGAAIITVAATAGSFAGEAAADVEILSRQPSIVTSVEVPGGADGVLVDGNLAYVLQRSSQGALAIFDLTDPAEPAAIGDLGADGASFTPLDFGFAADRLYLGSSSALFVIDLSDPTSPRISSTLAVPAHQLSIAGPRAYLTDGTSTVSVLDVTNASAPALLGSVEVIDALQIAAEGDVAYVGRSGTGLSVIDASDPSAPVDIADLGFSGVATVHIAAGLLYLMVADDGVRILDLDDPREPQAIGSVELEHRGQRPAIAGDRLYLPRAGFDPASQPIGFFDILDLSDPTSPAVLTTLEMPTGVNQVGLAGRHAIVAGGGQLHVVYLGDRAPDAGASRPQR